MIRRIGRHLLLLSVPLFIFLFISYRNYHGLMVVSEKPLLIVEVDKSPAEVVVVASDAAVGLLPPPEEEVVLVDDSSESVLQKPQLIPPPRVKHYEQANKLSAEKQRLFDQWHVLADGTVTHRGSEDLHRNITLLINSAHRCASLRANQSSFVVLVESDIVNFEKRQLIRDTWGLSVLQQVANYRVIFLVGMTTSEEVQSKLDFEQHMYEDMVQIAIYEGFQNLTYKSIHMLHWFTHHCPSARYLFKTDDDIYLHIPNLIQLFASTTFEGSLLCHHNNSRKILRSLKDIHYFVYTVKDRTRKEVLEQIRSKFHKYLISLDLLPGSLYPDYCSGFGYAMDHSTASKLLLASAHIPYVGIEDVFITGICREKAKLGITNNAHFTLKPYVQPIEAVCAFEGGRVTSNEMNGPELRKLWTNINTQGYYCKMSTGET